MIKIVSWNVNSVRVRLPHLLELIDTFIIGAVSGGGPSGIGKGYRIVKDGIESRQLNNQLKIN